MLDYVISFVLVVIVRAIWTREESNPEGWQSVAGGYRYAQPPATVWHPVGMRGGRGGRGEDGGNAGAVWTRGGP